MEENKLTTRQLVVFTVVLAFIVSVIGTTLVLGILGPLFGLGEKAGGPVFFTKPLEKIRETITQKEVEERILRPEELVVKVAEETAPSVVSVVASKDVPVIERFFIDPFADDPLLRQFFGEGGFGFRIPQFRQKGTQKQEISSGTGFIVSSDGLVITNKHVVAAQGAEYTVLMNDGSKKTAKVLAQDPLHDLAVLKIEGSGYKPIKLGDSSLIKIGQTTIAIGNALGEFRNTVSVGVISGLQRSIVAQGAPTGPELLQELIQTDAAINPGNSGGPLLNLKGEVIGINTAIAQGAENIGFAIPVNKAKRALENIARHGRIIYPFLGVRYVIITKDLAEKEKLARDYGVLIIGDENNPAIFSGSPAEKVGLKVRDIILEFQGERITPENNLALIIQKYQVDDEVTLKIFREDKEFEVKVKLEERK